MATSNYKVLTDVDLSRNSLLNVSNITNTDKTDTSLLIKTDGNTTLDAANLTGKAITGTTSLTTKNSEVVVTGTATEEITTSKTTTVAAATPETTTTETIDREGVRLKTPSQTVDATRSFKTTSPSITLVTGTPEGTGINKQAKITLAKTASVDDSAMTASAKEVTIDATKSITQTAPTSTYKTSDSNKIVLNSEGITLNNVSETVKLGDNKTSVTGTELEVTASTVDINNNKTSIISASGVDLSTDTSGTSKLGLTSSAATLTSPVVTLNGTGSNGITIKSGNTNSSSVVVKNTAVNVDSKGTLGVSANGNITVGNPGYTVGVNTKSISEKATTSSEIKSPSITLVTGPFSDTDSTKQASITLTKSASPDSPAITTSAKTVVVDATDGSITQTAPRSIYKADSNNSLELETSSVKIKSGEETITLVKSGGAVAANTKINSNDLTITAAKVNVTGNTTTSITSSTSITAKATSGDGTSTITTKPARIELTSKETLLTTSVNKDGKVKNSSIALSPANAESSLALTTDGKLNVTSASGARVDDDTSLTLTAPKIVETASSSISLSSSNINLQNAETGATKTVALDNARISIAADNAKVDIAGNNSSTPDTVTVSGAEFKISSGKSTFAENSKFDKNVEIVGNLTTHNMIGEAAELNSLNVSATTTVGGELETTGNAKFSNVTATGVTVLKDLLAKEGLTAKGPIDINGVDEDGKSLTVTNTASTKKLTVDGELKTENGGVTSAGSISILNNGSDPTSLTVNNTAEVRNLLVPGGTLTASSGMISQGAVNVSGTTSVGVIKGTGSLEIPSPATLKATGGGTVGRVDVDSTTISTIAGKGSLSISEDATLTVANDSDSDSVDVTNITIKTITGYGSLSIPEGKTLTINNGGDAKATGEFKPTNIEINTVFGGGNLKVPDGQTLTASKGGTINGSMTIGKAGSAATNLILNGSATIGTSGSNTTNLTSYAKIHAENGLAVKNGATFEGEATFKSASINTLNLNGVTIEWNSSLGALTFSRG